MRSRLDDVNDEQLVMARYLRILAGRWPPDLVFRISSVDVKSSLVFVDTVC